MRLVGSPSWQLSESVEQMLHVLLYTRDALGLAVEEPAVPPPLNGGPPAAEDLLAAVDRDRMASAWLGWWHDHVSRAALLHGADRPTSESR